MEVYENELVNVAQQRKLNSIESEHLLRFAERVLLRPPSAQNRRIEQSALYELVDNVADRKDVRARLLLELFDGDREAWWRPERRVLRTLGGMMMREGAQRCTLGECWSSFYEAMDCFNRGDVHRARELLASWKTGEAVSKLNASRSSCNWEERMRWLREAATERNDPDAMVLWADFVYDDAEKMSLYERAAELGSALGFRALARMLTDKVQRAMFWARDVLLSGEIGTVSVHVRSCAERLWAGNAFTFMDVKVLYVAGRELEGCEHVWGPEIDVTPEENACIDVYTTVVHRARRAALQSLTGFRKLGLARELALPIAQSVYQTRLEDAFAWYHEPRPEYVLMSETAKAAARSRRLKLNEFPAEHLISVVRATLLFRGKLSRHCPSVVTTLLGSAAKKGSAEASWLLDVIDSCLDDDKPIPDDKDEDDLYNWQKFNCDTRSWLEEALDGDESLMGRYYRAQALGGDEGMDALFDLAEEEGFGPAMSAVADEEESQAWAQRAVDVGDPDGFVVLAGFVEDDAEQMWLYEQAAELGSLKGLYYLARSTTTDKLQRAILCARFVLLSGNVDMDCFEVRACVQKLRDGRDMNAEEVRLMYFAGRELDGFEQFWDKNRRLKHEHMACIGVYLTVMHRARQAALQVIVGLRELRLFHDLALLIARFVYQTREEDPFLWYKRPVGPRPTSNKSKRSRTEGKE